MVVSVAGSTIVSGTEGVPSVTSSVRNLIANAVRHARNAVTVTIEDHLDHVDIHVDDDGPGIAPDQHTALFRRFHRLDEARTTDDGGSGLGLAIVASVAEAHGGRAEASDAPTGGARLSIHLPHRSPARLSRKQGGRVGLTAHDTHSGD